MGWSLLMCLEYCRLPAPKPLPPTTPAPWWINYCLMLQAPSHFSRSNSPAPVSRCPLCHSVLFLRVQIFTTFWSLVAGLVAKTQLAPKIWEWVQSEYLAIWYLLAPPTSPCPVRRKLKSSSTCTAEHQAWHEGTVRSTQRSHTLPGRKNSGIPGHS